MPVLEILYLTFSAYGTLLDDTGGMNALKNALSLCLFFTLFFFSGSATPRNKNTVNVKNKIYEILKRRLPASDSSSAFAIASTITQQSSKYKMDPFIITAVIAGESGFNPRAVGSVGEIGLMQIRPATAKWIALKANLPWKGKKSLKNPHVNIRLGVAYLSYLKERFSPQGGYLYLAANNMGTGSLLKLLAKNVKPVIYHKHIMKNYVALVD